MKLLSLSSSLLAKGTNLKIQTMIHFKNFNNFDSYFLNEFNGMESTEANKQKLREKIESLYIDDNDVHYDTKGQTFSLWNTFENSMLEIIF